MGLKVIGAGLRRTGTHSLASALERLGFGPCYTLLEIDRNPGHTERWDAALDGEEIDWDRLYQGYQSAVEWPTVAFLPQLASRYPDARFILTLRDPESWYESARTTIFEGLELSQHNPNKTGQATHAMKRRLILETTFSGKYRDKAHAIAVYEQHNRAAIERIPPDQLLQFHVREGWAPLCAFLEVPVPDAPFPRRNERADFLSQMPDWARQIKAQRETRSDD